MNSLTRIMSYDKTKIKNQENCNCEECVSVENAELKNQTVEYPKLSEEEIEKIISERYSDKDEKTKTFIRKALGKHGDRYDYSNVIYIKATVNVEIICRVEGHKPFPQKPSNHLQGQGCLICGGKQKLTTEEFIKRAKEIHGDKYDYSKVEYINNKTKVCIICKKHDEFLQIPREHLKGRGCFKCGIEKIHITQKLNLDEFIKRANEVHGVGTYDYSKVKYINSQTKIEIICPKHGSFWQTPNAHLQGCTCLKCHGNFNLTSEEFIEKVRKIHNNKYDYSKVKYINLRTKIEIICPKHKSFNQLPYLHLNGYGCPKCAREYTKECLRLTTEKFIEKANKIHNYKYDYSKVNYVDAFTKIYIICLKHGGFWQNPSSHLTGRGCSKCANEYHGKYHKSTLEEFIEKANKIHNYEYDYSKVIYKNCDTKVGIICPKHGIFKQTPYYHLKGQGCPKCKNNYKGEIAIRNFLTECKIEFKEQKRFKDCKDKRPLPFDFYLPYYNLCIKFDGEGHFQTIMRSKRMTKEQMEENLNYVQKHDEIKTDYCKNNGINLLRIRYDENVEEKLINIFIK